MMRSYRCDWCGTEFERLESYMKGKKHALQQLKQIQEVEDADTK